jgi:hypothetical protein
MEEQIEYNNVSKILIKKFPDIIKDALWLDEDDEILEYLAAGDFAKYIVKNINENNIEKLKECFEFIELLHICGTKKTKELATVGYLEDLQNITGGNDTIEKYKIIYDFLGIESKKWWDKLNDYWNGNIDALKE